MIRLTLSQLETINAQAEQAYPQECCGLLAGTRQEDGIVTVTRVVPSPNVLVEEDGNDGLDRFEVDPQVRFNLMRDLGDTQEEIIGHYHSHPDHAAKPSEHDLDMAFEPELIWLITAVISGHAGKTRAWQLNRDTREVRAVELQIEDI